LLSKQPILLSVLFISTIGLISVINPFFIPENPVNVNDSSNNKEDFKKFLPPYSTNVNTISETNQLIYSFQTAFFGGSEDEWITDMVVDSDGNIIMCGWTYSPNFPTKNAYNDTYGGSDDQYKKKDVFLVKFAPDGQTIVFSTYLGGFGNEEPQFLFVDEKGFIIVSGFTESLNFPTKNAFDATMNFEIRNQKIIFRRDIFLTKFTPNGQNLVFSTYFGGIKHETLTKMLVDDSGSIYLTGITSSPDFPTRNAYNATYGGIGNPPDDIFLTKFSSDGQSLEFSTFLGGSSDEYPSEMLVDDSGSIYIAGITYSSDFPTENAFNATHGGAVDVFLTKFSSDGQSLDFSTFLGGSDQETCWNCFFGSFKYTNMIVDETGHIILSGITSSPDFPTINAFDTTLDGWTDIYITKFSPDGQLLVFSTYLGGSDNEFITNMIIDSAGSIILSGWTLSDDFPAENALNETNSGINIVYTDLGFFPEGDGFLSKFSPDGQFLEFSTFLGGSDVDYIAELEIDSSRNLFIAGKTLSSDFPLINNPPVSIERNDIFLSVLSANGEKMLYSNLLSHSKNITNFWGGEVSLENQINIILIVNQTNTLFLGGCAEDCYLRIGNIDSDQDWMNNNWEVIYGLDPTRNDALEDLDGDGIPNFWEYLMGLIPNYDDAQEDLDNDGMPNLWEYQMGLSANIDDAYDDLDNDSMHNLWDKDGDWITNYVEYQEDTNASNFWSVPLFYRDFPFICFSCVHFLFLLLTVSSGTLGFIGAYSYRTHQKVKLLKKLGVSDYEIAQIIVKSGFPDYETFKKAQEINITSFKEYSFILELKNLEQEENGNKNS
jgi:hypothetical protein